MSEDMQETMMFKVQKEEKIKVRNVLEEVQAALKEKGYDPINQLIGYLLSGDPAYITSHKGARNLIRRVERDEIIAELLKNYLT
ncbi:IreB family regulatory phosphoprotein [Moorella sulfitireducens (nom. illeg.)]|uniref:IreB family regulatory phosphoprotein n=1 Tax=Neomoorella sulfitireducens TaxID=2972948 RepID=UPI002413E3CB|nr:IreB family regulatory phosphoprotein [Moorella sulfitireducens]